VKPLLWAEQTWETIAAMREDGVDMVLFPIGSTQQFGPHLPLCTGVLCAEVVAQAVSARTAVPVLPTLSFGCASLTSSWPGALPLAPDLLPLIVGQVVEAVLAQGFARVLILSADADASALSGALRSVRAKFPQAQVACKYLGAASARVRAAFEGDAPGAHGGAAHTALMLHLAPHLVRGGRVFDEPDRGANLVFGYSREQLSQHGHLGSPTAATAERGAELFEALVTDWAYLVKRALIERPPLHREEQPPAEPPAEPRAEPPALAELSRALDEEEEEEDFGLFRAPHAELEPQLE